MCCLVLSYNRTINCSKTSIQSPLETCGRLFPSTALRVLSWLIAFTAIFANVVAFSLRVFHKEKRAARVQNRFIASLSVADCLMGIYLMILTSVDIHYGDDYYLYAPQWRESALCSTAGFLAIMSSESSVFILTVITIDRLTCIWFFTKPQYRMSPRAALIVIVAIWAVVFAMSISLSVLSTHHAAVYGVSDVCIGLPFHVELEDTGYLIVAGYFYDESYGVTYMKGETNIVHSPWWLSVVIFIGINGASFLFILVSYILIFYKVKESSARVRSTVYRERETKVAIRMAVIVGTDLFCWMPVVIMGILTQTRAVTISSAIYAWTANPHSPNQLCSQPHPVYLPRLL